MNRATARQNLNSVRRCHRNYVATLQSAKTAADSRSHLLRMATALHYRALRNTHLQRSYPRLRRLMAA